MLDSFSSRTYSQNGEDGIIAEILRRCGITTGLAVEIGTGDGRQCNTRLLREQGWRCVWIDERLPVSVTRPDRHNNIRARVTAENIAGIIEAAAGDTAIDVLSIDTDGNDYYLLREILAANIKWPSLIIVEYNCQLPPLVPLAITYDASHSWDGSMYYGASLGAFCDFLCRRNYSLVHTNGINAFFVWRDFADRFDAHGPHDGFRVRKGKTYPATEKIREFVGAWWRDSHCWPQQRRHPPSPPPAPETCTSVATPTASPPVWHSPQAARCPPADGSPR